MSRSSPDATSSQYRVSPLAELVSDLCQSRASRHSPFLTAARVPFYPQPGPFSRSIERFLAVLVASRTHPPFRNTLHALYTCTHSRSNTVKQCATSVELPVRGKGKICLASGRASESREQRAGEWKVFRGISSFRSERYVCPLGPSFWIGFLSSATTFR